MVNVTNYLKIDDQDVGSKLRALISELNDQYDIDLSVSATEDGMDIDISHEDEAGDAIAEVHQFILYMSEDEDGDGLTADDYSGDLTVTTGTLIGELTAKKAWLVATDAAGAFAATLVATTNPDDQYVVAVGHMGKVTVSAVSDVNWEGV